MKRDTNMRLCMLAFAFAVLLGCEGDAALIHNPLVDRWCGPRPCEWEVKGKIERVGTWHDKDYAIGFASDHAQISQFNGDAHAGSGSLFADGGLFGGTSDDDTTCFSFTMIAKIAHGTRLYLELDFLDDGTIDVRKRFPESDWERLSFTITPPTWYQGVRFTIRKEGAGEAVLARLSAIDGMYCSDPPIELDGRPAGAYCQADSECADGLCDSSQCAVCTQDTRCGQGMVGK